eukprot:9494853-Pyramimonas_sp.AAC.2
MQVRQALKISFALKGRVMSKNNSAYAVNPTTGGRQRWLIVTRRGRRNADGMYGSMTISQAGSGEQADIDHLGLKRNDRLEPFPAMEDTSMLDRFCDLDLPVILLFWRKHGDSRMHHRHPLISRRGHRQPSELRSLHLAATTDVAPSGTPF